jgi:replicative DNA helicase
MSSLHPTAAGVPATNGGASVASLVARLDAGFSITPHRTRGLFPTGMTPLDPLLGGGLRTHELALLGGAPGVGKTVAALQWARHMATQDINAVYVCFEHDEAELLNRLLAQEIAEIAHLDNAPALERLREQVRAATGGSGSLRDLRTTEALLAGAHDRLMSYADRLVLVRGDRDTDAAALGRLAEEHGNGRTILFVDYVQKVAVPPELTLEDERNTHVAEALKDLALSQGVAVVAVAAATSAGLDARRLRLQHLRGASALAYESDVVIMLNEKAKIVSAAHLALDGVRAQAFKHYVIATVEKNRSGMANVDIELRKDFASFRFDPLGAPVLERLLDERLPTG